MQVALGIYQLKIPIPDNPLEHLNSYLIEGKDGWLMIDTGWYTADAFSALLAELSALGLSLTDITTIIVTHVHPNHFGLAGRIKHMSPHTELMTHRWEANLIESRYMRFAELQDKIAVLLKSQGVPSVDIPKLESASMPALKFVTMALPDHALYGGEIVSTGIYDIEVIWTPGHSPGHICLYEPQNELLFSGDHILTSITSNISYHVESGDNPLGDYLYALHKLENMRVARVLPAHQDIFTDLRGRIDELVTHHDLRKAEIARAIASSPQRAYDISSQLTWNTAGASWENLPPLHKRAAVLETVAHLECMRREGKVKRMTRNNLFLYALE